MVAAALTLALLVVTATVLVSAIGFLLSKEQKARQIEAMLGQGMDAYDVRDYEKAKILFDTSTALADQFDRLDPRKYPSQGRSLLGTARTIVERLRGLSEVRDLDEMRAFARDKGKLAGRFAQVYGNADALRQAADRLRFDLLLQLKDLPTIWREMQRALEPFYVLKSADWTRLEFPFGMLDRDRARQLRDEVDELLFLWVKAVAERLSPFEPAPESSERWTQEREILAFALEACDRAAVFAESKAPWRALRTRLARLRGDEDAARHAGRLRPEHDGEPADVGSERSALAAFEWARLNFPDGQMGRSLAWMRHAVRLRGDDYWYQYFLGYLEDLAGHPDEALEHYSIAAALQPDSPFVRFSRARLYRSKGKWANAFDDFLVALEWLGDRPEGRMVYLERGLLYQTMGDFVRAGKDYAIVIDRDATDDYGRAARLNRANMLADSGQFRPARAEYDALLEEELRDPVVRHSRAILELRIGEPGLADRDLTALLGLTDLAVKDRVEYLAERAQARLLLGRAADAVADACEARRMLRSPAHDRLAQRVLLAARRYDELQIDRPEDVAYLPLRGARLDADLRAAADALKPIAERRDSTGFRAGLTRAAILAAMGESREAMIAANRAASLSPFSAEARLVRARVLFAAGERATAQAEVDRILTIHPDHPGLLELSGSLKLAAGDASGARADFDRAMSVGARDGIHIGKASALLALGHTREALDEWSLALRRDPELPEAFLGRARTYFLLGDWDLGLADLEQAAAWAHADARIEAAVALSYLTCLPWRRDRLPRLLVHARRALGGFWHSLDERYHLAAGLD
jgi:tetratricopeptide (TPR) repeat protein